MNNHPSSQVIERVKSAEGELVLRRRGQEFEFIFNGVFLMASYNGASEKEMVTGALGGHPAPFCPDDESRVPSFRGGLRVLMGGLGMGLGLREALSFPGVARVDLFELEEAVVRWNRGPLRVLNGRALEDPRVSVHTGDIALYLQRKGAAPKNDAGPYHAIIMDTDNGPGWLSRPQNEYLYSREGTELLYRLLLPGGRLSVWSSMPARPYMSMLESFFADVREKELLEKTGQTSFYYLALKEKQE